MDNASLALRVWNLIRKPAVSLILRVAVSILLLAYLVHLSAFNGIVSAFSRIRPVYLLGFFLLYFLSVSLQSLRWKYLLRAWDVVQEFHILFRSIMIGLFVNNFLPSSLGGDIYRLYAGGRDTGKVEAVGATIFYERILGYGSLVILGLIALSTRFNLAEDWLFLLLLGGALLGLVALSALTSIPALERMAQGLMDRYSLARKLRLSHWLNNFQFKVRHPGMLTIIFLLSFIIQLTDMTGFRLVAASLQLPVSFGDLLLFVPLLYLAILLPVTFNGIGVRETVFVIFSSRWGIASADAVAFSLTVFALNLAGSLVGGVMYWFDRPMRGSEITKTEIPG